MWQQIDGTNSLKIIYDTYQKESEKDGTKFMTELLAEFSDLGFIGFIFPEYTGLKEEERLSFW